eukprot:COSAG02_NODE_234_length_27784_cov_12.556872_21_plen_434_part_00
MTNLRGVTGASNPHFTTLSSNPGYCTVFQQEDGCLVPRACWRRRRPLADARAIEVVARDIAAMKGAAQSPVSDDSTLPASYTSEEQAEDRQRALDELSAVAAIYGEAFSTQSAELRAFIETGEGGDTLGDATPLSFDLELQVEGDGETTDLLRLHCELPCVGYPSCCPAVITGSLQWAAALRPWEDHDVLVQLLVQLCQEHVGEEAVCEVVGDAMEWAQQRCSQVVPEPEPEPETPRTSGIPSKLSKYERSRRRHAQLDKASNAIANPGAGVLTGVAEANQGAARHAAAHRVSGSSDNVYPGFDVEVMWADGSTTMVRAKDVRARLRPPLDKTVAKDFADMPPQDNYEDSAKVRCLFDGTWQRATVARSTPAAAVQVAEFQSDAEHNQRFNALTAKLEQRGAEDDDDSNDTAGVAAAAAAAAAVAAELDACAR